MNLKRLFEMQKVLDDRIIEKHGLEEQDLLPNLILALQVELGESANEWRGYKHGSKDQEPRVFVPEVTGNYECQCEQGYLEYSSNGLYVCEKCEGAGYYNNPLLEEYVDCLHFILSIGNRLGLNDAEYWGSGGTEKTITNQFIEMQGRAYNLYFINRVDGEIDKHSYEYALKTFIDLGEMLGYTWDQIEQAYIQKNEVNHARQENNY